MNRIKVQENAKKIILFKKSNIINNKTFNLRLLNDQLRIVNYEGFHYFKKLKKYL